MKKTALIMAGGKGERFWPRSRVTLPKQFLSLTDDGKTMIQLTVERIRPLVELEDVYIATNKNYKELVKRFRVCRRKTSSVNRLEEIQHRVSDWVPFMWQKNMTMP